MSATQSPTEEQEAAQAHGKPKGRSGRRGLTVAVVVGILIAGGVGVVVADPFGREKQDTTTETTTETALAKVTKGTLSARTLENGTLGFAGDYQVVNKTNGTITKLPSVGKVIPQGKVLYRVDGKPVILLQGPYVPAYRDLSWGMEGTDVRQLNAALVALKYATKSQIDPDSDYFGRQTYCALKELQKKVGAEETGELPLGQAVFLPPEEIRITKVNAVTGDKAAGGGAFMQASSTDRQVTVALNANQQADVAVGNKVTITLPNGKSTPGVVSSVGKVATKENDKTTIDVQIKPSNPKVTGELDQAPVQVAIVSDTVEDVLSVPVNALLATAGRGYAVEVVDPSGEHRLVAVKTGLFDDSAGQVEVTGSGLEVDQKIVVPSS